MLKLGCYELPDDCKVELRRIVDDIPADELLAYAARLQPLWARGVRLIPDNLCTLQERMFRGLATRSKLNNAQFQFLAAGLSCRFIHQLDVTFIDKQLGALIEEYGRVALVLTLLTDERFLCRSLPHVLSCPTRNVILGRGPSCVSSLMRWPRPCISPLLLPVSNRSRPLRRIIHRVLLGTGTCRYS